MSKSLIVTIENRVATITINRESRMNSLDHVTIAELGDALDECARGEVSVVVLRGAGTRAFCAGDDLKAYADRTPEESVRHHQAGLRLFDAIEDHPCLFIAAIEGYCLGGGLELAMACDYRIAGEGTAFGLPEVRKLGAFPSWGGMTRLPKLVGLGRAKELVLIGERFSAERGEAIGLVSEVAPTGGAFERASSLAQEYAGEANPHAVATAKQILTQGYGASRDEARFLNEFVEKLSSESDKLGLPE